MILVIGGIWTIICENSAFSNPPTGTRAQVNGETMECFTLEQYKRVLQQDVNLTAKTAENTILQSKVEQQALVIDNLVQIRIAQERTVSLLSESNDRLFTMWDAENKRRHEAESKPSVAFPYLAWTTVGVLALSTAVLGGMALSN